jgi:adenosylhomocysteine nucleosidase
MSQGKAQWLIAAAVEQEIQGIRQVLAGEPELHVQKGNVWSGTWRGDPLRLIRTGVGPEKARAGLTSFLGSHPCRGIVSTGYAGGLQEGYRLGDILVPAEVQSIPPLPEIRLRPDPRLREAVLEAAHSGPWQVHTSRMITTNRVISSREEKERLGREYDAGSVEMESAVIAEVATNRSIPFVAVRVVLDEANFSLPDHLEVLRWWQRRRFDKLVSFAAFHPFQFLELLRLGQRSRKASERLSHLFRAYLLDTLWTDRVG